ncbi:helix-turn-helix domain-containing protein [Mesorhizobium sp.]|uniref:helix-turn-helix domain-containing protein n=1 Tax=Mesorhizobium sp. TaxID=1871066 RepID=UPI002579B5C4|nr:helix-turn-helix domain-containing protein [Mesorhizobium sp.]
MSAFLLGIGFRADMGTCARKLVLLKLIDACDDDGSRIFPAISTIARAAQCSTRQVQRELKAFLDIGLIRLVREGGKGPRSTNEYALDLDVLQLLGKGGWALVASEKRPDAAAEKGDTVSPLDDTEKGDTGSTERVTLETSKGDKLSHPTPPYPSLDPSVEREREREDGKKIDADGWALLKDWPGFAGMPKEPALKVWRSLEPVERAEAARLFPHWLALLKAQRKTHTPAPSTYFGQKLWREVPEPQAAPQKPAYAPAFGPVWAAIRMRDLVTGPKVPPSPLKGWEESAIANGRLEREALEKGNRMRSGWPMVNALHQAAETRGLGIHGFGPEEERLGKLCEFVPIDSDVWKAWKLDHELRGWPWLPDPGTMRGVYFPAGGPAGLEQFEQAVRGDHDAQQAAE